MHRNRSRGRVGRCTPIPIQVATARGWHQHTVSHQLPSAAGAWPRVPTAEGSRGGRRSGSISAGWTGCLCAEGRRPRRRGHRRRSSALIGAGHREEDRTTADMAVDRQTSATTAGCLFPVAEAHHHSHSRQDCARSGADAGCRTVDGHRTRGGPASGLRLPGPCAAVARSMISAARTDRPTTFAAGRGRAGGPTAVWAAAAGGGATHGWQTTGRRTAQNHLRRHQPAGCCRLPRACQSHFRRPNFDDDLGRRSPENSPCTPVGSASVRGSAIGAGGMNRATGVWRPGRNAGWDGVSSARWTHRHPTLRHQASCRAARSDGGGDDADRGLTSRRRTREGRARRCWCEGANVGGPGDCGAAVLCPCLHSTGADYGYPGRPRGAVTRYSG